jgi:2-polyprenyl-3-methyl-5-hydroxy-6-metoxy-1,4-benzoquinol methylase
MEKRMIAPRLLPAAFDGWNARWHAPHGRDGRLSRLVPARRGPFGFQANNSTRRYEYPWAYSRVAAHRAALGGRPLDVVEIGGSLAGLQWVLAREGHRVTNVDPGLDARGTGWEVSAERHRALSRTFRAPVTLVPKTLAEAALPDRSVDVLLSVSTIEHFAPADLAEFETHAARVLRPDGIVVLTIDLFLNLAPFCAATSNQYGTNVDVYALLERAGLSLREGVRPELYGFPEFTAGGILERLAEYTIGGYPALAQCLVASR